VPAGLDFSASGEEMRFGYFRGNSSKWPITTTHGVDNWRIEVVPEP
jgi:hypothetical protein